MTPQQLYIIERAIEAAPTMYECTYCHHVRPDGIHPCDCGRGERIVDPMKVWEKVQKELAK